MSEEKLGNGYWEDYIKTKLRSELKKLTENRTPSKNPKQGKLYDLLGELIKKLEGKATEAKEVEDLEDFGRKIDEYCNKMREVYLEIRKEFFPGKIGTETIGNIGKDKIVTDKIVTGKIVTDKCLLNIIKTIAVRANLTERNIPVFRVSAGRDTGKAEIAVGKILEMQNKGVSDSVWVTEPSALYFEGRSEESAKAIVDAYDRHAPNINLETIVTGAAHRLGVYIAALLNCPFIPMQFVSFAKAWDDLKATDEPFVAGFDYDADPLIYVCSKPEFLPQAYRDLLKEAKNIIVVTSTNKSRAKRCWQKGFAHSSVFEVDAPFKAPKPNFLGEFEEIPDWEYSLLDEQLEAFPKQKKLALIKSSTNELYQKIPILLDFFYQKNGVAPKKFVFNAFWIAHPFYEIESLSLPICFYRLDAKENLEFISHLQKKTGITDAELYLNDFGGDNYEFFESYLVKSGYFNIRERTWGADNWDNPNSSSRLIAYKLEKIFPRKWKFLDFEDVARFLKENRT